MKNPKIHDQNHGKIHTNAHLPMASFEAPGPFSNQVQQALAAQRERRGLKAAKDAQVLRVFRCPWRRIMFRKISNTYNTYNTYIYIQYINIYIY